MNRWSTKAGDERFDPKNAELMIAHIFFNDVGFATAKLRCWQKFAMRFYEQSSTNNTTQDPQF